LLNPPEKEKNAQSPHVQQIKSNTQLQMPVPSQFRSAKVEIKCCCELLSSLAKFLENLVGKGKLKSLFGCAYQFGTASTRPRAVFHVIAQAYSRASKSWFSKLFKDFGGKVSHCRDDDGREDFARKCKGLEKNEAGDWVKSPTALKIVEFGVFGRRMKAQPVPGSNVPHAFLCPISQELMKDPVLLVGSGHSYENSEISRWLQQTPKGSFFSLFETVCS
jgi:hypothetical protein